MVGIGAVFTLARFSEAFLALESEQAGIALALVPLVMVAMNLVYSATAYPFGRLADRMRHETLLAVGLAVLVVADLVLAASVTAGLLWDRFGAASTDHAGAVFCVLALAGLLRRR